MSQSAGPVEDPTLLQHLAAIVESSDDAILSKTPEGIITSWNAGAERMYGYTAEEAVGQPVSMLVPEERSNEIPAIMQRLQRGERVDHYETVRLAKDGCRLHVSLTVSPIRDSHGRLVAASSVARDISAGKHAEAAQAAELADYRRIAEISSRLTPTDDVQTLYKALVEAAVELTHADRGSMQLFDREAGELCLLEALNMPPRVWDEFARLSPEANTSCAEALRRAERVIVDYAADERIAGTRDAQAHLDMGIRAAQSTPLVARSGHLVGMLSTHWNQPHQIPQWQLHLLDILARQAADLIERTQTEQALRERKQELQQLNETLERRVAERTAEAERRASQLQVIAKELTNAEQRERQRLAQLLHDDLQQILVAAKLRQHVGPGADDAELGQLVTQAIETSRSLSAELAPPVLHDPKLVPALEWLARWAKQQYRLKVTLEADQDSEIPDEQLRLLLFQAIRELLLNVVKHAGVQEARVLLRHADDDAMILRVEDAGQGFDPAVVAPGAKKSSFGLSSLHERLEVAGAQVNIHSAPGNGTRVQITVPPARISQQTPTPAPIDLPAGNAPPAEAGDARHVLVVDDHDVVRQGLANLIEQQPDMEVVAEAGSGEEALELARRHRPHVVVMDVSLPGISGIEATRQLMAQLPHTCVIGLSVHAEDEVAEAMRSAGAQAYFQKCRAVEELVQAVRRLTPTQPAGHRVRADV